MKINYQKIQENVAKSQGLEEAIRSVPLPDTSTYAGIMSGGYVIELITKKQIELLVDESCYLARSIFHGHRIDKLASAKPKGFIKRLLYKINRKLLNRRLNEFYAWLQDDKSELHSMKNYLSIRCLNHLKERGVPINYTIAELIEDIKT